MKHIFRSITLLYISFITIYSDEILEIKYSWSLSDKWSSCAVRCGDGYEVRSPICLKKQYLRSEISDQKNCEEMIRPKEELRSCNYGNCTDKYRWVVSPYGSCSRACGHDGIMKRTAYCIPMDQAFDNESHIVPKHVDPSLCDAAKRPQLKDICNHIDCEPEFVYLEWGECMQNDVCEEGKQKRKFQCVSKLYNGTDLVLHTKACSKLKKPFKSWRTCSKNLKTKCKDKTPQIHKDTKTIVQMKRNRVLDLKVGQNAFIIPLTKLTIHCPTQYFASQDLKWYHEKHGVIEYNGTSIERIKIDEQGRLIIENFEPIDKGQWICKADKTSASIMLSPRSVADGFLDWLKRTQLMKNDQMLNEDPKTLHNYQEIVQWVESPWNNCPAKCGETANQTRQVRCEKVKARSYEVLDDNFCESRGLPRPLSTRSCQISTECPQIVFVPDTPAMCSNECISPGLAKAVGQNICKLEDKVVELEMCKEIKTEIQTCENSECKLKWVTGEWSKCSKECGDDSFKSRSINCIWEGSQKSAGSLCLNENLPIPDAIQQCKMKPCIMECVDLINKCESKKNLCRFSMFQFYCCNTCKVHMENMKKSN